MRRVLLLALALLPSCARAQGNDALAPLLDFARRQPGDVAVVTYAVRADGTPDPARHTLSWNAAQPMPLASTRKIVVLVAYARAVAAGRLDPQMPVRVSEWESFYLPGTDGGAHASSLRALGISADAQGRAQGGSGTVPLDTLARFMLETSDNAATDVLLTRLGREAVPGTVRALGLTGQEDFGPVSGLFAAWFTPSSRGAYAGLPLAERVANAWTRAAALSRDPAARAALVAGSNWLSPEEQATLAGSTDARGTAGDYAGLMSRVLTGTGLSAAERGVMVRHLGWPMRVNPDNAGAFASLYAKGGSLPGILTNNFAFQPKVGPAAGKRLVVSLFLRGVPPNEYSKLEAGLEDAMLRDAIVPGDAERLLSALRGR